MDSKKEDKSSWFTRSGLHVIVASVVSTMIGVCGGSRIANQISQANLILKLSPQIRSNDPLAQKIAFEALTVGVGKKEANKIAALIGAPYGNMALHGIKAGDLGESKKALDEANYISPLIVAYIKEKLVGLEPKTKEEKAATNKILNYSPEPLMLFFETASGTVAVPMPSSQEKR